jgi:conjugative transfer region protein (TIGR03748 family)
MRYLLLIALTLFVSTGWAGQDPVAIKTDRYTLAVMEPTQSSVNPLQTAVTAAFATNIITIGEAVDEVLDGTGYRVRRNADQTHQGIYLDSILLNQPLPAAHRELGPLPLIEILQVIAGSSWKVKGSDLSRTVSFSLNDAAAPSGSLLDLLVDEVDGLAYTMRAPTEYVSSQGLTAGHYEPNATTASLSGAENQSTPRHKGAEMASDTNLKHSLPLREVAGATSPESRSGAAEPVSAQAGTNAVQLTLLAGESLVSAIMKLQSGFTIDNVVYSVRDKSLDINRLTISDDIDVNEELVHRQSIELNESLTGFVVAAGGENTLIITDNHSLHPINTVVFDVKPGSVQSNAKRLMNELGWQMPFKGGWQAQDYPITSSFPIAISREDPRQAFSELLSDYPIQARLNPSTETVYFVRRNPIQ